VDWGNGSTGSFAGRFYGAGFVTLLSNGNFVIEDPVSNSGRGAVTWVNGSTGKGAPSLVGSNPGDLVGGFYYTDNSRPPRTIYVSDVTPLKNGNYVVGSRLWNGGRGAVTLGNGSTGISGTVSEANSLVGTNPGDLVGYDPILLNDGNYLVQSPFWNDNRGAVSWGNGGAGITGAISQANSLIGTNPGDAVGASVTPLSNGNYVVKSPSWSSNRGAITWGNGSTGTIGAVSDANSLVAVGAASVTPLSNSNYVVGSVGGVTWVSGTTGQTVDGRGIVNGQNSLPSGRVIEDPIHQSFLVSDGRRVTVGLPDPNQFSYARGQAQTVSLTPDFLTSTLNTGTAVILQASNDITVNSPMTVSAGGQGGPLTLQAGRSILLNANITTDNGALTLIANDQVANGVVDSQRDAGNAVITMAAGTALDTGSGSLTVELRDGFGLTHSQSGTISLQTVTAGSVTVLNNGPSAGSDVKLGAVTSSGSQYYANPHGTTLVTGNLTAADSAITFTDSVVVSDGVTVTAGANSVNFAGSGTQTLHSGNGSRFDNVNHTATGTLQLTSGLIVTGSFLNGAGTFDANDQAVTVAGAGAILGGTYLAGTAPQTFRAGLSLPGGLFTSSTGPMTVSGGIRLLGGSLNGVGSVDSITAFGGTVAPGGNLPGVLTIGAAAFNAATTLSILINGREASTGYSQLAVAGPIDLGGSTLSLTFGFEPPVGSSFEILTGSVPISGTFSGLDEGAVFTQGSYQFQITYQGGTGGDNAVVTRLQ
jgi:hypothetical protein